MESNENEVLSDDKRIVELLEMLTNHQMQSQAAGKGQSKGTLIIRGSGSRTTGRVWCGTVRAISARAWDRADG